MQHFLSSFYMNVFDIIFLPLQRTGMFASNNLYIDFVVHFGFIQVPDCLIVIIGL